MFYHFLILNLSFNVYDTSHLSFNKSGLKGRNIKIVVNSEGDENVLIKT